MRRNALSESMSLPHPQAYMVALAARAGLVVGLAVGVQDAVGAAVAVATRVPPSDRCLLCPLIQRDPDLKLKIQFWLVCRSSGRGLKTQEEIENVSFYVGFLFLILKQYGH